MIIEQTLKNASISELYGLLEHYRSDLKSKSWVVKGYAKDAIEQIEKELKSRGEDTPQHSTAGHISAKTKALKRKTSKRGRKS